MKRWYAIHTLPRGEEIALKNLKAQGFDSFLPRYHKPRRHARKMEVVVAPLFPRYLFVALDLEADQWLSVNSTRGVAYIVRQKGCPAALPDGVIDNLKQTTDLQEQETVPLSSLRLFSEGSKLEVVQGAFAGYTALYEKMTDGERVQLLLNMLGREVRISVPAHAVVAIG